LLSSDTIDLKEILVLEQGKEETTVKVADSISAIRDLINAGFSPADAVFPHITPKAIANEQLSLFNFGN
jgi:hypothetical protein